MTKKREIFIFIGTIILAIIIMQRMATSEIRNRVILHEEKFTNLIEFQLIEEIKLDSPVVSKLAIKEDKLYVITENSTIYIIDIKSKKILQEIQLPKEIKRKYDRGLEVYKNYVIIGSKKNIVGVNINDGTVIFDQKVALYILHNFFILDDVIFYSIDGITVYAVDFNSLDLLWRHIEVPEHAGAYPVTDGNGIYFIGKDEEIVVLNKLNGNILKSIQIKKLNPFLSLDQDHIYVRTVGEKLYKVNKYSGEIIWSVESHPSTPVVDDNTLYFYDFSEKKIIALALDTGDRLWEVNILNYTALLYTPSNNYLFIRRADGKVISVDKRTGEELWQKTGQYTYIETIDELLIMTTKEGDIHFFDISKTQ